MRTLAIILALSSVVFAQPGRTACTIAPSLESEYRSLASMADLSRSWEERYGPRRALAKKYPADWPLQFALQAPILAASSGAFVASREWDLALDHYRALPDRALGELLEARFLSPLQRARSRQALDRVLGQAEDSPWAHLAMLEWARDPRHGDRALAEKEFEAFRRMCPEDRFVFRYLETVRDPEKLRRHVRALRGAIESDKKRRLREEDIAIVRVAWTFERVVYGRERLEEFRKTVRADLDHLRRHPIWDSPDWSHLVSFGYEDILGDKTAAALLEEQILNHAPKSNAAYLIRKARWRPDNSQPLTRFEFPLALVKEFWGQQQAGVDAAGLLSWGGWGVSDDMVGALADFALSTGERFPDQLMRGTPLEFDVAQRYVDLEIRMDRVPGLVARGLREIEARRKHWRDRDTIDEATRRAEEEDAAAEKRRGREILIGHAIASGQIESARALSNELRRELDAARPAASAGGPDAARWRAGEFNYRTLARKAGIDVRLDQ